MLSADNITVTYSGMKALEGVSVRLAEDEFVSIIGPNGAGKSTLLRAISGTVPCTFGTISFRDRDITSVPAHERTRMGIIQIPEGRRVFPSLTVMENLELGAYPPAARERAKENLDVVLSLFPVLAERRDQIAGTFSGGQQQMLAIGRGLMSNPKLLMLDEPSLGLSPVMADSIFEAIKNIRERMKFTIFLVEQRAVEALELCDRAYILESGRITVSSDQASLKGNPVVQKAYLGVV